MSFQEACESPDFKQWLVVKLEPLCDADPEVMADYIIALLKHETTLSEEQWKEYVATDLADFLEANSRPFVEELFATIRIRSYLPPSAASQPQFAQVPAINPAVAPGIAPSAIAAQVAVDQKPILPVRPTPTGPAAGPSSQRRNGDVDVKPIPGAGPGPAPGRREPCRDYHERGFCMRGVNCPYEHSEDVIIPSAEMMFGMPPFGGMGPDGPGPGPGDGGRGGMRGRGAGRGGRGRGGRGGPGFAGGPQHPNQNPFPMGFPPGMMPMPMGMGMGMMPPGGGPFPPQHGHGGPHSAPDEFQGVNRAPSDRNGTTILLTDVPPTSLTVPAVRDWFAKFGEVTNIAIEGRSRRALVSFGTNAEAYAAWKSDDAVFGSRHVKVLWHRPRPGQGGAGQKALDASAGLIANMNKSTDSGGADNNGVVATLEGPESRLKKTLANLEAKERRSKKETLVAEQKVLLNRAGSASKEDKVVILGRLRELVKEIEEVDKAPAPGAEGEGDVEMGGAVKAETEQDELLKLNAQLSALRDKASGASTLGIPSNRYSPYSRGSSTGSYRARGRGASRGARGGAQRGPMRLDNRSKTVIITGDALTSGEGATAVRAWYESTGGSVEDAPGGGVVVSYPSREMAEKALALGTKEIANLPGGIHAAWHTSSGPGAGGMVGGVKEEVKEEEGMAEDGGEVEMGDEGEHERRDE